MEPRTLTYRSRPRWARSICVFVALIAIVDLVGMWSNIMAHPPPNYGALLFFVLWFGSGSLIFFWMSGPDDLSLNSDQRTYRHVKGWPFFPKTRTGPFSDFWGIYVGRNQHFFGVGVTWWGGGSVTLKRFSSKTQAEQFAASLMSDLELKQVMPPRNLRPSA